MNLKEIVLCFAALASLRSFANQQVLSILTGYGKSCALLEDKTVWCWGTVGTDKDWKPVRYLVPREIEALRSAVEITISYYQGAYMCGRFVDGRVLCGWTGNNDSFESPSFIRPSEKLASDGNHHCSLQDKGQVACWGRNESGQLGRGTTSYEETVPQAISNIPLMKDIVVGRESTCSIDTQNALWCWGNLIGPTPEKQSQYGAVDAVGISHDDDLICVASHSGNIDCFGDASVHMEGIPGVTQFATDDHGFFAKKNDGTVFYVQITNVERGKHKAEPIRSLKGARYLAADDDTACAVRSDGLATCWGGNYSDQLGLGAAYSHIQPTPRPVPGLTNIKELIGYPSGYSFAVDNEGAYFRLKKNAITWPLESVVRDYRESDRMRVFVIKDGRIRLRGYWYYYSDYSQYYDNQVVPGLAGAVDLSIHIGHGCALMPDASVSCLGMNHEGQVGFSSDQKLYQDPVTVPGVTADGISVGSGYSCALLKDSNVKCWGAIYDMNFGTGPQFIENLTGVVQIAAGEYHACAVLRGGTVSCWGSNSHSQLGDTRENSIRAAPVPGLNGVAEVAVGYSHSCARKTDGSVYCWGDNEGGQLGIGTISLNQSGRRGVSTPTRVQLADGERAISLSLGYSHSCAILSDMTVKCWGYNYGGQLALGFTSTIPLEEVPGPIQFD